MEDGDYQQPRPIQADIARRVAHDCRLGKNAATEGQVFNIGNGEEVSIRQLAEMVIAKTASTSPIRLVPHRDVFGPNFEDMSRRVPDIGRLQQLTGYKPGVDLDEILDRVIQYWSPQPPPLTPTLSASVWTDQLSLLVH